jgi:hypothetical protein
LFWAVGPGVIKLIQARNLIRDMLTIVRNNEVAEVPAMVNS